VIPADTLATQITFDEKTIYSEASQKRGNGYTVSWPDGWNSYKYLLNSALLTSNAPWQQLAEPLDGAFDNVLAGRVGQKLVYYLNNGDSSIEKKIAPKKSINIEPRTLVEVKMR